jgi:hypothetical protein
LSFDQLGGRRAASFVWSGHIRPGGILSPTPPIKLQFLSRVIADLRGDSDFKRIGSSHEEVWTARRSDLGMKVFNEDASTA